MTPRACLVALLLLALNLGQALAWHPGDAGRRSHAVSAAHVRGAPATVRTAPDIGPALPSAAAFDLDQLTAPRTAAETTRPAAPSRSTRRETLPRSPPDSASIA